MRPRRIATQRSGSRIAVGVLRTTFGTSAKLRAQHLHRAIALRLESAKAEVLAQRVVRDEGVKRSPLPNNLLARGGENLGERSGFFIVERHAFARVSKGSGRLNTLINIKHRLNCVAYSKHFHCTA